MMNIRLDEKKLFLDRIRQSLKKLNNLLSLSKIPLQLAAADGQIMVEFHEAEEHGLSDAQSCCPFPASSPVEPDD